MADPHGGGPSQRERALLLANRQRTMQRQLADKMQAGDLDPFVVIAGNGGEWEGAVRRMTLRRLLLRVPGVGEATLDEVCEQLQVRSDVRLQGFTYEKRQAIADLLRDALQGPASTQIKEPGL